MEIILIALGGFFGSIARFYLSQKVDKSIASTLLVNVLGSVLLAIALYFHMTYSYSHAVFLAISVGFCGAFTTFSTFSYETFRLGLNKQYKKAIIYVLSSFVVSISVVSLILVAII